MAWFPCNIGGGGSGITIAFHKRIIEQGWDNIGSITYTFDEDIDDCILVLTYTRETTLSNTQYTLTLASGSYEEMEDSGAVIGSVTQERVVYLKVHDIKIGDTLYMYNYGDLKTADILKYNELSYGNATVKQGTFVSATSQFGIVDVDCGFKPDMVMVRLPFGNNDTTSYWEKGMSWAETKSLWNLYPAESIVYVVDLDRQSGETGIQAINNNGFSFMSNGGNTQGITCEYIAVKYEAEPSGGGSAIEDYTTNYFPVLLNNSYYTVFSKVANDEIYNGGRGGTRASSDPVFYFCCKTTNGYWGYGLIGLTSASVQITSTTSYGDAVYYTQTTTNGNTVYLAKLGAMISGQSGSIFKNGYFTIELSGSQYVGQDISTDLFDQTFVDAAYEALTALS